MKAGSGPRALAVSDGSIWVANEGDGTVSRIDPATNKALVIKVGSEPDAIAAGEGAVWVVIA